MNGQVYTPRAVTLLDLHDHDIYIRSDAGQLEVSVMAMYSSQRKVILWEEGSARVGDIWPCVARACCDWMNMPAVDRDKYRFKPEDGDRSPVRFLGGPLP